MVAPKVRLSRFMFVVARFVAKSDWVGIVWYPVRVFIFIPSAVGVTGVMVAGIRVKVTGIQVKFASIGINISIIRVKIAGEEILPEIRFPRNVRRG